MMQFHSIDEMQGIMTVLYNMLGRQMKQNWQNVNNCRCWEMSTWGFAMFFSLILGMFENFQAKFFKQHTSSHKEHEF